MRYAIRVAVNAKWGFEEGGRVSFSFIQSFVFMEVFPQILKLLIYKKNGVT